VDILPDAHEIYSQGDRGDILCDVATATLNSVNISLFFPSTTIATGKTLNNGPQKEAEHLVLKKQTIRYRRKLPALFLKTLSKHTHETPHDSSRKSPTLITQDMTSLNSNTSSILIDGPHAADGDVYTGGVSHALSHYSTACRLSHFARAHNNLFLCMMIELNRLCHMQHRRLMWHEHILLPLRLLSAPNLLSELVTLAGHTIPPFGKTCLALVPLCFSPARPPPCHLITITRRAVRNPSIVESVRQCSSAGVRDLCRWLSLGK